MQDEMSNELLQTRCDDDGLKLIIKICHKTILKHAIFRIIGDLYGGLGCLNRAKEFVQRTLFIFQGISRKYMIQTYSQGKLSDFLTKPKTNSLPKNYFTIA